MTEQELKEKIYKKFKKEIINLIEITKKTNKKVHFDLSSLTDVYNISMSKAPEWFTKWNKTEFRPLVAKVDENTVAIEKNTEAIKENAKAIKMNHELIRKYHPE